MSGGRAIGCIVFVLLAALLLSDSPIVQDSLAPIRADAAAAAKALDDGRLATLERRLGTNRGNPDFAYYFTSKATPRALGDALASVAGNDGDRALKKGIDPHAYEMTLTDLAGTLALATHGAGRRALPKSWTEEFIKATTAPNLLEGNGPEPAGKRAKQRGAQDVANMQNLLLLLSRGFWSVDFLVSVTEAYWDFDHSRDEAWPIERLDGAKYAPAPNGRFLTDGMLALTAALTANPTAAHWAFADFQSGTKRVDGSDYELGKFTHHLVFEHKFPYASDDDRKGDSIGMTATLTALSSAIEASPVVVDPDDSADADRPAADALVLQKLAKDAADSGSLVSKAWDFAKRLVEWVWHAIQRWGHPVLLALSLIPPPFGLVASGTNAVWYAIEGDYLNAGLSLAAVIPTLALAKFAKEGRTATVAVRAGSAEAKVGRVATGARAKGAAKLAEDSADLASDAKRANEIAKAAKASRVSAEAADNSATVTVETLRHRPTLRKATQEQIRNAAPRDSRGNFIDPNTKKSIPKDGPFDYGHKPGYEWRCTKRMALAFGWTQRQLIDYHNNPDHYQIEDPSSNRSRVHEGSVCAR